MNFDNDENDAVIVISVPHNYPLTMRAITKLDSQSGFSYRVDPENMGARTKRHIHIWKGRKKDKGVSWNEDGTRHDKHSFNTNLQGFEHARDLAKRILTPKPGTIFDLITNRKHQNLCEALAKALFDVSSKDIRGRIIIIDYENF